MPVCVLERIRTLHDGSDLDSVAGYVGTARQ